jgi:hypothetical protein
MATGALLPELPEVNRAALWLAYLRRLGDSGLPLAEAVRLADEQLRST